MILREVNVFEGRDRAGCFTDRPSRASDVFPTTRKRSAGLGGSSRKASRKGREEASLLQP